MIPAERQAINGRTWTQVWEPRAIEVYRKPRTDTLAGIALAVCIGLAIVALALNEFGAL